MEYHDFNLSQVRTYQSTMSRTRGSIQTVERLNNLYLNKKYAYKPQPLRTTMLNVVELSHAKWFCHTDRTTCLPCSV